MIYYLELGYEPLIELGYEPLMIQNTKVSVYLQKHLAKKCIPAVMAFIDCSKYKYFGTNWSSKPCLHISFFLPKVLPGAENYPENP